MKIKNELSSLSKSPQDLITYEVEYISFRETRRSNESEYAIFHEGDFFPSSLLSRLGAIDDETRRVKR